jgi:alkanesulfonate monooxygenase SsuD/methylene tetrahydromethanopterin reductase-like flavin-dependent oxidoreductase (luciferase family)
VRVGLYFDLRNPPGRRTDPTRLYAFTLEMCEEAERLGIDSIWVTEHHMFDDDYLPQPLTFLAAVAARTTRVRLGTAIIIAPLHHAAEIAEQAAVVDIVSGGRLDLGLGAGYRVPEYELFGADIDRRYTTTDSRAVEIRRLWDDGLTPRPVQERLPIFMGYQGPKGAARAGRLGEGLLHAVASNWPPYRDALIEAGHGTAAGRMIGGATSWTTDDPDRDWPMVARHLAYQQDSYRRYLVEGTGQPLPRPVDPERMRTRTPDRPFSGFHYGLPTDVAAGIRAQVGDAPVEEVYLWASLGGMPEDVVARNVTTIATKLAPLLRDA